MATTKKPQGTLLAMVASNPGTAKPPGQKPAGMRRGAGGGTPKESGMDAKMNFGQGHGHSMFSTMPLMGHAMSGTQLGQVDNALQKAHGRLARFAEGGEVKKPAGPSAKERKEIRSLIERGKDDAVTALRSTRSALLQTQMPQKPQAPEDYGAALDDISQRLAMKDGGQVATEAAQADPRLMYQEYSELMNELEQGQNSDPQLHMQIVDRLSQLAQHLEALGIPLPEMSPEGGEGEQRDG